MKDLYLFRRPGDEQLALAIFPILLAYLTFLVGWGWRVADWPTVIRLPPTYLVTLTILMLGAFIGLRRGTPPWAYSWIAQALHNLSPLVGRVLAIAILPGGGLISSDLQTGFTMAAQGFNQFLVFLALVGSLLLVKRSRLEAFFFFLLFLGARTVTYPIQFSDILFVDSDLITGVLAIVALTEGILIAVLLYQFLTGDPASWRPFWWLLALVLLDPLFKLWPLAIQIGDLDRNLSAFGIGLGITSLFTLGFLALQYGSVRLYQTRFLRRG